MNLYITYLYLWR